MKLLLAGDVMLGRLVNEVLKYQPANYPWSDTLPIFQSADFRVVNLECVISDKGRPWSAYPKAFHFRSDAKNIEVLKTARIDAVTLANNHILDFEYEAMLECLEILERENIAYAGAGRDLEEAAKPAICQIKNLKIGVIAFTDNEPEWEATRDRPGTFYVPIELQDERAKALLAKVKEAKRQVDILIVAAHWGPNWGYRPPKEQIPFAHALIDSGADVIFGHSGHVFRGIEIYRNRPTIYCAGDFIDDYAIDEIERNDESFIFLLEFEDKVCKRLQLFPTIISDFQAQLAPRPRAVRIAQKMQELCEEFGTQSRWQDDGSLEIRAVV
ncbi:MAG: CapA family protein [Candidatus Doudnabacteria bacterium]|nr:CapA family protein [Candidatus Doudnabacteria bacterium]